MEKVKRINKSKADIVKEMVHKAKINEQKELARIIFKCIEAQDSIYDAQTVVSALSGFIKYDMQTKEASLKVNDLLIDLSKEPKTKITEAMEVLKIELQDKNAKDIAMLLERFGQTLGQYGAAQFLKNTMSSIKIEDIIA